jgi:hypothetical protein
MRTSTQRLERLRKPLEGTQLGFREHDGYIGATCPGGNHIRCFQPNERFGRITLGIPYVKGVSLIGNR